MKGAANMVLDHLHDLGHRKVVYLGGHSAARSHALHMQSVLEGVEKRGMTLVGGAQMVGLEPEDAEKEMKKILGKKDAPTAVICGTDTLAQGVFRACFRAGVEIPKGMSVTGVGDGELSRHGMVPLTTVRFSSLGKVALVFGKR
jgi:DNA-binding LacI/PurR family transcriptional regulator